MKLSIVIMVKNEEKNLLRTLPSLTKLRENIDSELVIMDTGSTDNSIEIAKTFTNRVFEVKWNNDFASMRNKSISFAQGEWVLILDADEEIAECDNLIKFFKSGIDKNYNSCMIELKNFLTQDLETFEFVTLPRLFKNQDLKYDGAIHEQPNFKHPIYSNSDSLLKINHYGYMFDDLELRYKKMKRNEKILFEELNNNPNDEYINFQLGINFMILEEVAEAENFFLKALKLYKKKNVLYYPLYAGLINLYMQTNNDRKCKNICLEYLKKDKSNLDIYYWLGKISKNENNFEDSIKYFEKYLYLSKNYHLTTQAKEVSCSSKTKGRESEVLTSLIESFSKLENYNEVIKKCNELESINSKAILGAYKQLVNALYSTNNTEELINRYIEIKTMPNKNLYIDAIETVIKKINQNEKENIFTIFSKLDDNYGAFNKMRIEKTIDIQKTKNIFENETSNIYSQLIEIALDENIDIKEILVGLSYTKIEGLIDELLKNRKESVSKLFDYIIETNLSFNPYSIMVDIIICEKLLYTSYLSKDKKIKIFNLYTSIRYIYLQITQSNLNNEELILLSTNQEDVFVSTLKHIEESFYNDIIKTIKLYKNLGEKFPKYIDFIKIKVDKINTEFNSNSELKMLKTQFVVMIKNAVATNNLELAKSLLSEFESIDNNRNSDIESIKSIIALNEGDIKNSHKHIKKSYLENNDNFDAIYNLGYIYFLENNFAESLYCFEYIVSKCKDSNIVADAIDFVESNLI